MRRAPAGLAVALAIPAAVAGTALPAATIVFAALGLAVLAGGLAVRRWELVATALALLGVAYAAGLPAGLDAWAPLHAGALVAVGELAERSWRPWGPGARHVLLVAGGATAAAALALAAGAIDAHPAAALRLAAIAAAGVALVLAARVAGPVNPGGPRRAGRSRT